MYHLDYGVLYCIRIRNKIPYRQYTYHIENPKEHHTIRMINFARRNSCCHLLITWDMLINQCCWVGFAAEQEQIQLRTAATWMPTTVGCTHTTSQQALAQLSIAWNAESTSWHTAAYHQLSWPVFVRCGSCGPVLWASLAFAIHST